MKHLVAVILLVFSLTNYAQDVDLYEISNITQIEIEFTESNWDAILDQYYSNDMDERLPATVTVNGKVYDSVGVQFKGNSTYNANNAKNPLNIKLDYVYDQTHQGYEVLKLSTGDKDPSFVREVLSYEIGRKYMDMPLSNYAVVYVNGDYYGLFTSNESINGQYVERRFYSDKDNTRIKCNPESVQSGTGSSLMYLGTDSTLYYSGYEVKSDFGWNDIVNLCYNLQYNTANIETYLDVDRALWMLAFNNMLVNLDSYTGPFRQNYYLLMDDNGRMLPVIWDLNQSIGSFSMVDQPSGPPSPPVLTDLTEMDPYLRESDTDFPLIYYLFANSRYRKMYLAHCRTILEENIANGEYYTRAQQLQAVVAAEVQNDPNANYTYTQFTSNLDNTVTGSGPGGGTYGLSEVMGGRLTYLQSHVAFNYTTPVITSITNAPFQPEAYNTVTFTADIQNANYAYLGYREYKGDPFTKVEMFDDGLHGDGAAADGVWGASIVLGALDIQYYIYAENTDAAMFSPVRAEHEFYELTLSGGVVINEIMSDNFWIVQDQDGEYNDWIELYNNSGSDIDLSGYYLSDDDLNPTMWQFPSGTVINAYDYLIVWCDKDTTQDGLHTNFKLNASGEVLILSDASGFQINKVQHPDVGTNFTYGRYPNGTGGFIPMTSTYNAENSYTNIGLEEEIVEISFEVYPNPASDQVNIFIDGPEETSLKVYSLDGKLISNQILKGQTIVSVSGWTPGVYLIVLPELNITKKLMVR